jgi:lipid-A-disaccharide synthase-like uncharacterized protein
VEAGSVSTSEWILGVFVVLTAVAQAAILAILIKRNKHRDFPVFFWYNALAVGGALILLAVHLTRPSVALYFYLYWAVNTLLMLVEFAVMYEIFVKALKPYNGLIDLGKMLFRWAVAFLLLAAAITTFATHDSTIAKCLAAVSQVERSLRLMQCGLLLLFFLFERRLGLAWRSHTVSIGLGLGFFAALNLSSSYLRAHFIQWSSALDLVDYSQYLAVISFWAVCFYVREPERNTVLDSPSKLIFQRWNDVLVSTRFAGASGAGSMGSMDSFLPNVEQTVDRILARKMVQ